MDLSIIIPTRDRNTNVIECILALDHNDAEIIVVDDASQEAVVGPHNSARIIRHDRRRGRSTAINTGLRAARYDTVLIMDDDIYAAPDMVVRLMSEFFAQKNPKLGLTARVTWDPDVPLTLTMKWIESVHKFRSPILLSKNFLIEHGGYDENFTRRLEDMEIQLRLKHHGLELCRLESAVGFQNSILKVRDLAEREFIDGVSAVFLHAKFPQCIPQVNDFEMLLKNEAQTADAEAAVDEIALIEHSGPNELAPGLSDLYANVCRHYFMHGIFEGLKDIGGMKPRRSSSSTNAIYKEALHLEEIGEFDEARRLFRLVLHRPDDKYWADAEYHLGHIEMALGNSADGRLHLEECLRLNPAHTKARRTLHEPAHYREVESNVFERVEPASRTKVLFVLFGDLGHVVNAVPVIATLQQTLDCETSWLTSPEHAPIARGINLTGTVYETKSRGIIPWDWIHQEGFTHVFFPEPGANREEWERSGLHAVDFIAKKCRLHLKNRRARLQSRADAIAEAERFLEENNLSKNAFLTAAHGDHDLRHWPNSSLMKLGQQTDLETVVFGKLGDPEIPGTVLCIDKPFDVIALLISWSCFYLGPAYGVSWLATTTDTPMAVFFDPLEYDSRSASFRELLQGEKDDIQEWDIYTNFQTVLEHIETAALQL
jgi:glycosyltransferase involved in cell wall biosynthesis